MTAPKHSRREPTPVTTPGKAVCRECGGPNFGQGYCQRHWRQAMRAGLITTKARQGVCSFPGCQRGYHGKGYCRTHYDQHLAGRELSPIGVRKPRKDRGCDFPGCDRPHSGKGWCKQHNRQAILGAGMYPIGAYPRSKRTTTAPTDSDAPQAPRPKPKPRKAPVLPAGWDRKRQRQDARPPASLGSGGVRVIPPVPPTPPKVRDAALATLARLGAIDLADNLGLTTPPPEPEPAAEAPDREPKWLPDLEEGIACGWLPLLVILSDLRVAPETATKKLRACGRHDLAERVLRDLRRSRDARVAA